LAQTHGQIGGDRSRADAALGRHHHHQLAAPAKITLAAERHQRARAAVGLGRQHAADAVDQLAVLNRLTEHVAGAGCHQPPQHRHIGLGYQRDTHAGGKAGENLSYAGLGLIEVAVDDHNVGPRLLHQLDAGSQDTDPLEAFDVGLVREPVDPVLLQSLRRSDDDHPKWFSCRHLIVLSEILA
jgi:hypothetical protein